MTVVKTLGDYYCPKCGILGQLKIQRDFNKYFYYRVDHYKGKKGIRKRLPLRRGSKYAYSCYLGKIAITQGYQIIYPFSTLFAVSLWRHFL